jgi:AraC-like DNA-binding protein
MFEQNWESLAAAAHYRPRELATLCTVSLRTLQRHFSGRYGTTLTAWLRAVRLNQAYERIKAGEAIKMVSYELGFKQPSHFSRVFKQVHGVAPSEIAGNGNRRLEALLAVEPAEIRAVARG